MLDQIANSKKTGFDIKPLRFSNETHISLTFQNKKKDFQAVVSAKDGGYIGMQKTWTF